MKLIIWIQRSSSVDIGEQKVYSNCHAIEQVISDAGQGRIRIKYTYNEKDTAIKEHVWEQKDIIKVEMIP